MISPKDVKVLDINSEYFGTPTITLMENAGKGIADFITNNLKLQNKKILIICGVGNNGGDGFVAARYLSEKNDVSLILIGDKIKNEIAQKNFDKLKNIKVKIYQDIDKINNLINENVIILDSMLGTGLSGSLREPFFSIVNTLKLQKNKTIISVDIPTGLGTNISIRPNHTVTFHDLKEGMNELNCGQIHVVDIGIPEDAMKYVGPGELSTYYPRPKKDSHKGQNGTVLVIGGGPYTGAPALCGLSALRTGADLVFIATPESSFNVIASFSENLIVKKLNSEVLTPGDVPTIRDLIERCDSIVLGPGLGTSKETERAVVKIAELIKEQGKPLVIDADAIKPIGEHLEIVRGSNFIFTPHRNEFKKLTSINLSDDVDTRIKVIHEWAKKMSVTIFLKGQIDILNNGKQTKLNKVHNEAMTVGGTGDVLAGIIGALLSKGLDSFNALKIAAFLNGEAGNLAFDKKSFGLVATDLIQEIPNVLKRYL